jgi:hypothetical protein
VPPLLLFQEEKGLHVADADRHGGSNTARQVEDERGEVERRENERYAKRRREEGTNAEVDWVQQNAKPSLIYMRNISNLKWQSENYESESNSTRVPGQESTGNRGR